MAPVEHSDRRKVLILTSKTRGLASRSLPVLCRTDGVEVTGVILVEQGAAVSKRLLNRKLNKIRKIGLGGALNGYRMRDWFTDRQAPDLAAVCAELGVEMATTPTTNCDRTRELFRAAGADLALSLGNSFIAKSVFSIPRFGMVNVHMEVLPEFQGASSVIWPIYEGVSETGFTIHQVEDHIDTGEMLYQERYPIQFHPTLRETVNSSLEAGRRRVPEALALVCSDWDAVRERAVRQPRGKAYTTPSLRQYLRIVRNHRRMYAGNVPAADGLIEHGK